MATTSSSLSLHPSTSISLRSMANTSINHTIFQPSPLRLGIVIGSSCLTLTFGLTGAILVLLAISRYKKGRKTAFHWITTSLMATIIVLKTMHVIFTIPTYVTNYQWKFGDTLCKFDGYINQVNRWSIFFHCVPLMFYVIFSIKNPLIAKKMDRPRTIATIFIIFWIVALVINFGAIFYHRTSSFHYIDVEYCYLHFDLHLTNKTAFIITMVFMGVLTLASYILLIGLCISVCVLARQRRTNRYLDLSNQDERHLQEFVRLSILFTVLTITFSLVDNVFNFLTRGWFGRISFLMAMFYPSIIPWMFLGCVRELRAKLAMICLGRREPVDMPERADVGYTAAPRNDDTAAFAINT